MFSQKLKKLLIAAALILTPFVMDVGCTVDLPAGDLYWGGGSYYDRGYDDDVYVDLYMEDEYYWEEDCYDCYDDDFFFDGFFDWF